MPSYTIQLKANNQDSITYENYNSKEVWEKQNRWANKDFDEILEHSIIEGYIEEEGDITCYCSGSDNCQPYFSANEPWYEASIQVEMGITFLDDDDRPEFDENVFEYDLF